LSEDNRRDRRHHARKPSSESVIRFSRQLSETTREGTPIPDQDDRRISIIFGTGSISCSLLEESQHNPDQFHTNASEPSLSDLGAWTWRRIPKQGLRDVPDTLSRSDINRSSGIGFRSSVSSRRKTGERHIEPPTGSHASRDAPEPDSP